MEAAPKQDRLPAVFDCMVFLQGAARRESPSGVCLALAEQGIVELCVSQEILAEVAGVLTRPRVRAKFPALTDHLVAEFMASVRSIATVFENAPREFTLERDSKDEAYLNLACHANAGYLVSWDPDLLDLADANEGVGRIVRNKYPVLKIVDPITFLCSIRSHQAHHP